MSVLKLKADVEFDSSKAQEKVESLLDDEVMLQIQELFAETIDPWTPFLSGALHETLAIDATGVTYLVPYSAEKYYGVVYTQTHHPLATSHWDKVAMETEMESFEENVKQILIERAKQLYG